MDTKKQVGELARALYRRATHRLLANPLLGTFTAFLSVLLLIRIAANLYLAIRLSLAGSNIDAVQIASAHFILLSSYMVWIGALASFRIGSAVSGTCFIDFARYGPRFRSRFMRRIAFLRPMNVTALALMVFTTACFSLLCGNWPGIVVRAWVALASTYVGIALVTAVASWSAPSQFEIRKLEMLYLLLLVALNPDIGSFDDRVGVFFGGLYWPFSHLWMVLMAVGLPVMLALLVLLVVKTASSVGGSFRRQFSLRPMAGWYWRLLRIRSWVLLYVVITPIFVSHMIAANTKRWTLALSILFSSAAYLYYIAHCENTLHDKWRCSLADRGSMRLIARPLLVHFVLMMIPVLEYIVFA